MDFVGSYEPSKDGLDCLASFDGNSWHLELVSSIGRNLRWALELQPQGCWQLLLMRIPAFGRLRILCCSSTPDMVPQRDISLIKEGTVPAAQVLPVLARTCQNLCTLELGVLRGAET